MMLRNTFTAASVLLVVLTAAAQTGFETATQAVQHMGVGWNLGNTLDAMGHTLPDPVKETTAGTTADYETWWGQPVTRPELMQMLASAGFGVIRVPVTWWPHMDDSDRVDKAWMDRVEQVVGYVLDAGMYCILNVHHDTGANDVVSWLTADTAAHRRYQARFCALWQQIAERFRDRDQRLLFEGYNEMLSQKREWNFAADLSSYDGLNAYAQDFVTTVRATGGNNAVRNIIVNTYAAACGGTWNAHCNDVLTRFRLPDDPAENHLMVEVHNYAPYQWSQDHGKWTAANERQVTADLERVHQRFAADGVPVVVGEFGVEGENSDQAEVARYAYFFVKKAKNLGMVPVFWMGLTDGLDRSLLRWTWPQVKDALLHGYYGDDYVPGTLGQDYRHEYEVRYDHQWAELCLVHGSNALPLVDYRGLHLTFAEPPAAGTLQLKIQSKQQFDTQQYKGQYAGIGAQADHYLTFNPQSLSGGPVYIVNLQYCQAAVPYSCRLTHVAYVKADGTEEEAFPAIDYARSGWGCAVTGFAIPPDDTGLGNTPQAGRRSAVGTLAYDLCGRPVAHRVRGISVRHHRKVLRP